jgi:predicted HAD superfamily Cof-like phosphohydrolase
MISIEHVKGFHERYGLPISKKPRFLHGKQLLLRVTLLEEELKELFDEFGLMEDQEDDSDRYCQISKEMVDVIYVILGMAVEMGIDIDRAWDEVHRSNMTKSVGEKRDDGKQLKGDKYRKPNLKRALGFNKICREGMEHIKPCSTLFYPDGEIVLEECGCGCSADDYWCMTERG